jgi:hypothetical protein
MKVSICISLPQLSRKHLAMVTYICHLLTYNVTINMQVVQDQQLTMLDS